MKVSVIIPTYNRANLICKTINNIFQQDFKKSEFEVIVVNNNSSDETDLLLKNFVEKFQGGGIC